MWLKFLSFFLVLEVIDMFLLFLNFLAVLISLVFDNLEMNVEMLFPRLELQQNHSFLFFWIVCADMAAR